MIEYIILMIFIVILSVVFFHKKCSERANIVFVSICFCMLFCMSALRLGIGLDYYMYAQGFFKMGMDGFDTLSYLDWEWGFTVLTKIIVYFTRNIHIYMAIMAAICLTGPFYLISRYSKKAWLSVLLYVNLYFFYCTMNYLRQSIAISILMFAYPFLLKRKILPYMGIVVLASLFHITALIMIPVYFVSNFKASYKIPILYCFLILWTLISSIPALDLITGHLYEGYRDSIFLNEGIDFIHILIPTMIIATALCFLLKFKGYDKILVTHTNLLYVGYFFMITMLRHAIFERFSYYTYIYVILYIPELTLFLDNMYKDYLNHRLNKLAKKTVKQHEIAPAIREMYRTQKEFVDIVLKDTVVTYKKRRKAVAFCITALIVAITVSYNVYGLLVGESGVHGVYPYKSWLYELFGG